MGEVADLWATLGAKINTAEWNKADSLIKRALGDLRDVDRKAAKMGDGIRNAAAESRRKAQHEASAGRALRGLEQAAERERRGLARLRDASDRRSEAARLAGIKHEQRRRSEVQRARDSDEAESRQRSVQAAGRVQNVGAMLGGLAAYMGQRVVREGVTFNATMEDSKNEVAGMLALAHKGHLTDELKNADMLVDNLRERASKLPGTTSEYVQMLSMITQPITDAKLGLKDLEDLTVNSVIAAKGLHVPWQVAARDIDQAIRGQYHQVDPFSGKVLGGLGYKGEEGRARYNALTQEKRASEYKRGLLQPQITELGVAAGKSFSGLLSTMQDAWEHFTGLLAKPLFDRLKTTFAEINVWLEKNNKRVEAFAHQVGDVLVAAFGAAKTAFIFLTEHGDLLKAVLIGLGSTIAGLSLMFAVSFGAPVLAAVTAVTGLVYIINKLIDKPEEIKAAFEAAFAAIADIPVLKQLIWLVSKLEKLSSIGGGGQDPGYGTTSGSSILDAGLGVMGPTGSALGFGIGLMRDRVVSSTPTQTSPPGVRVPISSGSGPAGVSIAGDVNVTVSAPNAEPDAVAAAVGKHFDNKMGRLLRTAMDTVAK